MLDRTQIIATARRGAIPALIFTAVGFALTAQAYLGSGRLIGETVFADWAATLWGYWWTVESLLRGQTPFVSTDAFYPVGQRQLFMHNLLDALLASPLVLIAGPRLGYNLFATLTLITSAFGAYWLARQVGASWVGAMAAGVGLETSNYLARQVTEGRLTQAMLLPMFVAFVGLYRLSRGERSWWWVAGTGIAFAATALGYWYYGLFLVIGAIPLVLATVRQWDRARWIRISAAAAVGLACCLPLVISQGLSYGELPGTQRQLDATLTDGRFGADQFNLYMATHEGKWPGWPIAQALYNDLDLRVALMVLLLAGAGLVARGKSSRWRWAAVFAIGYVLTLGPYLNDYRGDPSGIPLPFLALHHHLPFFERLWWPARAMPICLLGLVVLSARGFDYLASISGGRIRLVAVAAAGLLILDLVFRSTWIPIAATEFPPHAEEVYGALDGALVTTPVLGDTNASRHNLALQTRHGLPMLSGNGDHIRDHLPPGFVDYVEGNTLLLALAHVVGDTAMPAAILPGDVQALIDDGFRWVVVDGACHDKYVFGDQKVEYRRVLMLLWGQPAFETSDVMVWPIQPLEQPVAVPAGPPGGLPGSSRGPSGP